MLQTSLLLMKSLNKTETPIFLSVVCSLFPKAIFLTFIYLVRSFAYLVKKMHKMLKLVSWVTPLYFILYSKTILKQYAIFCDLCFKRMQVVLLI